MIYTIKLTADLNTIENPQCSTLQGPRMNNTLQNDRTTISQKGRAG
jgi:hypothetical protein